MEHNTAKRISNILIIIGTLLILSLYLFQENAAFNTIMLIVILLSCGLFAAGIVISVKYYRCPHCHSLIRTRYRTPKYCPECGEAL